MTATSPFETMDLSHLTTLEPDDRRNDMGRVGLTLVFIAHWQRRNEPDRRAFLKGTVLPALKRYTSSVYKPRTLG